MHDSNSNTTLLDIPSVFEDRDLDFKKAVHLLGHGNSKVLSDKIQAVVARGEVQKQFPTSTYLKLNEHIKNK